MAVAWGLGRQRARGEANHEGGGWDDSRPRAALEHMAVLSRVSLHHAQVFRLLLKTSVERNTNELKLFLAGFAVFAEPCAFVKMKNSVPNATVRLRGTNPLLISPCRETHYLGLTSNPSVRSSEQLPGAGS